MSSRKATLLITGIALICSFTFYSQVEEYWPVKHLSDLVGSLIQPLSLSLVTFASCKDQSYYELFGMTKDSFDTKKLKKAYIKLSKQYHPDKNKDPGAEEEFKKIGLAYQTLMDSKKKEFYDRYGTEGLNQGEGYADPFNVFEQFVNFNFRGFKSENKEQSPPIFVDLPLSLKEVFDGGEIWIDIDKQVICPLCNGSGAKSDNDIINCGTCKGTGVRVQQQIIMGAFVSHVRTSCDACNGKGKTIKTQCSLCKGKRVNHSHREVYIKYPRGIRESEQLKLDNAGDEHPDKIPGPIYFNIVIEKDPVFNRIGDNLYVTRLINLYDAMLGFTKDFLHLNGKYIKLDRSGLVTQPGYVQILKGYGLPKTKPSSDTDDHWWSRFNKDEEDYMDGESSRKYYGDLFVTYQVILPDVLSESDKEAIEKLLGPHRGHLDYTQTLTKLKPLESHEHEDL